ncbi:MAG TPA: hypothetical protein VNN20_07690 [Thermodesulfobacteriota bacterium]|nr:hypothetical protein [Thermodesulfobacteriota bacterium]
MIGQLIHHFHYIFAEPEDEGHARNDYNPKYVAMLLKRREPNGKVFFYFKNRRNYISLFANGHINVREDDGLFKPWGVSEFKDIKPQDLFERLEKEIAKIRIPSSGYGPDYHFYSYGEFLDWLRK